MRDEARCQCAVLEATLGEARASLDAEKQAAAEKVCGANPPSPPFLCHRNAVGVVLGSCGECMKICAETAT